MRILYIGTSGGTCALRAAALERLGHTVTRVDPVAALSRLPLRGPWLWKLGGPGFDMLVAAYLKRTVLADHWDIAWVDCGDLIGPSALSVLKKVSRRSLLLNQDNPFVARDGRRWALLHRALSSYDLYATPRQSNVAPALSAGVKSVVRIWFSADEVQHRPVSLSEEDHQAYGSDVAFIGTWMPGRDDFALTLIENGVPLSIFGPRWDKSPGYERLKGHIRSAGLSQPEYVKAVQSARICIGLLSEGNEDLHTTRSMEIPALGSVLCAQRTPDHTALYEEGREAVFWETPQECAEVCKALLADPERLAAVARAGQARVKANGSFNEPTLRRVLETLEGV
ncbi:MAG: glycosyltransferase [Asticcacaulis sp.]